MPELPHGRGGAHSRRTNLGEILMTHVLVPILVSLSGGVFKLVRDHNNRRKLFEIVGQHSAPLVGISVLALLTCALAIVVPSFTFAVALLWLSVVYLVAILPKAL